MKFEYALSSGNWLTLAKLMSNTDQAKMLRDIVVSKKAAAYVSGLPKQVAMTGKSILKPLNRVQQRAIFKTMMAEEFVLLKGNIFTGVNILQKEEDFVLGILGLLLGRIPGF